MKRVLIIAMLCVSSVALAANQKGDLLISQPVLVNEDAQTYEFDMQFEPATSENMLLVQKDTWRDPTPFSYADILEAPLRAVVRIETLAALDDQPIATGSGVIVDSVKGYIVTNSHVISAGKLFKVRMADGRWRDAKLVGHDSATDLAVMQVSSGGLSQIEVADTGSLRIGDVVFAVGYPLGLDQTASIGIISGLGRSTDDSELTDYIQTDAAINSGNSGGALLDAEGKLVGINTALLSTTGGNMGIGFAIPAHMVEAIVEQLTKFGDVRHGHAGLVLDMVSEKDSAVAGTANWEGALVAQVEAGSPAAVAGLEAGDVIVNFNGRHVQSPHSLRAWIGTVRAGTTIDLEVWRRGNRLTFALNLVPLKKPGAETLAQLGANVRLLSQADGVPEGLSGVKVESVRAKSPAEDAGLLQGDVIISINNELVTNPQVCDRLVHETAGRVGIVVFRSGLVRRIIIDVGDHAGSKIDG